MDIKHLEKVVSEAILDWKPLSGGDTSTAYRIQTANNAYFLKTATGSRALPLYTAEKKGLQQLAATQTIAVPAILAVEEYKGGAFFIMEFINSKRPNNKDFELLGRQLAQLHLAPVNIQEFGNERDNFIGSLPQDNTWSSDWTTFYVKERLEPQLKRAFENGLLAKRKIPETEMLMTGCGSLFEQVSPSLIHGDFWSGNYLIRSDGKPFAIDPAPYYGHSVVDLAMSKLFGGFAPAFYEAYHELIPQRENQKELEDIYQLYYLLVHLNLFGRSYKSSVTSLLQRYF